MKVGDTILVDHVRKGVIVSKLASMPLYKVQFTDSNEVALIREERITLCQDQD